MKKKIKKDIFSSSNFLSPPPWHNCKSKELAWKKGYESGKTDGALQEQRDLEEKRKSIMSEEQRQKLKALSDICQAGSTVVEGMTKALLSYSNNL